MEPNQQAPAVSARNQKSAKIEVINLDESQKSQRSSARNTSREEALLHLDVALGKNQSTRIVIYEGEDYN